MLQKNMSVIGGRVFNVTLSSKKDIGALQLNIASKQSLVPEYTQKHWSLSTSGIRSYLSPASIQVQSHFIHLTNCSYELKAYGLFEHVHPVKVSHGHRHYPFHNHLGFVI